MALEKKEYRGRLMLKEEGEGEAGEFEAVFATLNVEDRDGDVTLPGAFGEHVVVVEPWNHNYQAPPVGRGTIGERENEAVLSGKFFLDTPAGLEHYTVVKHMRDVQEWSYSFYILEAEYGVHDGKEVRFLKKLDVVGVGPVTRGTGVDTRVTDIKGRKQDEGEAGDGKPSDPHVAVAVAELDLVELEEE